jgi:flagellar protein FlgJ
MMLKSMRDANHSFGDSLLGSSQQDMYQDMFDDQLTSQLAGGRGLGLSDLLFQQLSRSALGAKTTNSPAGALIANPAPTHAPRPQAAQSTAKQDFVRSMLPLAREAGAQLGVDPHTLVAQAALETGWGKSVPATPSGDSSFNLFGIKAGARWSGPSAAAPTREFEAGAPVRKVASFRSYDSAADSFRDYAGLIRNNPRYADAVGAGTDVAAFASALQQGGYATDPQYAQKVTALATEVRELAGGSALKSVESMPLQSLERKSS